MNDTNPYAVLSTTESTQDPLSIQLEPCDRKKIDTIIEDAGHFWLAIILSFACTCIAAMIVPVWYGVRIVQWMSLSNKYPQLISADAPPYSLQAEFKAARWKLILGILVGGAVCAWLAIDTLSLLAELSEE